MIITWLAQIGIGGGGRKRWGKASARDGKKGGGRGRGKGLER